MKIKILAVICALSGGLGLFAEEPKLVVTVLVDQLRYDYMERFAGQFGEGGFRRLEAEGAFVSSAQYNYFPTVTGPGHASFASGMTPAMHGIIANDWFDRRSGKKLYCVQDDAVEGVGTQGKAGKMSPRNFIGANFADQFRLHYGTKVVGISMKDRGAILPAGKQPAGAYWFESTSGNFITSSYYEKELPAWVTKFNQRERAGQFIGQKWERLLEAKNYQWPDEVEGEGRLDGEKVGTFPHQVVVSPTEGFETIMPTPFGNQLLLEFAQAAIEGEQLGQGTQPDLLCVSFSSVDYCGHRFGPYSQEVQDIVLRFDRQLAELLTYLDAKMGRGKYDLVLTADHGVAPTPEFAQLQGFDGRRVNIVELMGDLRAKLNERFGVGKYLLNEIPVDGNLYFNAETLRAKSVINEDLGRFIREWALASGFYQACYTREQLLDGRAPGVIGQRVINGYNAERSGDVVLVLKPFMLTAGSIAALNTGSTHGSPYSYDSHVPVFFFGPHFKTGRFAEPFNITDIVPTLSVALRIEFPPAIMGAPALQVLAQVAPTAPAPAAASVPSVSPAPSAPSATPVKETKKSKKP